MLNFEPVKLEDRAWAQKILYSAGRMGCEYTFANLMFWMSNGGGIARVGDFICPAAQWDGQLRYLYPVGTGDPKPALEAIRADAAEHGKPFALRGVTEEDRAVLDKLYPGKFTYTLLRDSYDYLYPIEQLTELSGKKLQAKRNHINRFIADNPDWYTLPLDEKTAPLCEAFATAWYETHDASASLSVERRAIERTLKHFRQLEVDGLLLSDGSRIVAFSVGCRASETMYDVNFEKADPDVPGAYAMINREFSRMVQSRYPEVRWLNREDDMGLEGLRRAKESYHPQFVEKAEALWQD